MKCDFCLSEARKYFKDGICRRCLHLRHGLFKEIVYEVGGIDSDYTLEFELTPYQKEVADLIAEKIVSQDVFLEAVCGAGKTEMCYELIKDCLNKGLKIGWAIPRRQVVLELGERLKQNFKGIKVVTVCEGFTDDLIGDLVVCTTHQLFRYKGVFDVLVLDEPDAFPFSGNDLLFSLMKQAVKGHVLYMSATLSADFNQVYHIKMPLRPSLEPLPIPVLRRVYFSLVKDIRWDKRVLIFVPTIKMANLLAHLFGFGVITSKTKDKEAVLEGYLKGDFNILVTTTILERGVTFVDCYVYVLWADHPVFDAASLIQIAGRVKRGRSTEGACYFYALHHSLEVKQCLDNLRDMNTLASIVLKITVSECTLSIGG